MNEIRDFGNEHVVLFTNVQAVYDCLQTHPRTLKVLPYCQGDITGPMAGADLYFSANDKAWLENIIAKFEKTGVVPKGVEKFNGEERINTGNTSLVRVRVNGVVGYRCKYPKRATVKQKLSVHPVEHSKAGLSGKPSIVMA